MTVQYGILWDVDGTLVDTAELHFDAWVRLSKELGHEFTREHFAATFGRRNPEIVKYLYGEHLTDHDVISLGHRKEIFYRAEAQKSVSLLPGVERLLNEFAAAGALQAIGSSAPRDNLQMILDVTKTAHYFQGIVGQEDTQRGKPDPQVFLNGAAKLGLSPKQCLVFEDAVAGVEAAKAAGMACVAITFVQHHPDANLRAAGADLVVPSLESFPIAEAFRLIDSLK
jgi:beta-phosphoglucomutase